MSSRQYEALTVQALRKLAQGDTLQPPDSVAQCHLGRRYAKGAGVDKDEKEAAYWFRLAADGGNAEAQRNLAFAIFHGRGVAKNDAEGIRRLRRAADCADAPAQLSLCDRRWRPGG